MRTDFWVACILAGILIFAASVQARESNGHQRVEDITKETLVGPGDVQVITGKDVLMSFGAQVRMIPTSESSWDFGMNDNADGFLQNPLTGEYALGNNFFKDHVNEAGWINNSYIRNEDKLYFNAMPKDRKWSFYAALEFDSGLENTSVDARGGKDNDTSAFGLERLHATMALPAGLRLHAGWDIWGLDIIDGASMVGGEDAPGFWLTGGDGALSFNMGYFKYEENDFQNNINALNDDVDDDRDVYAGYVTYKPNKDHLLQGFYALDRIRGISVKDLKGALTSGVGGILGGTPDTDSHHVGAYYIGHFGGFEIFGEGVYQFGSAEDTGLSQEDFDINAYGLAANVSYEFKGRLSGFSFKPHLGVMYTSGDGNPDDDQLNGYNGLVNGQRFSRHWGGENTVVGDTNLVLGTLLYSYLPELYGNGTPVFTGGLQNTSGLGGGRGDNPGMTMFSVGLTMAPRVFLIYRTNANSFYWNEEFEVADFTTAVGNNTTTVKSGHVGTEWDNELTLALSGHTFIKGQCSFFFPGERLKDVTEALSGTISDDTAVRIAAELIWTF